MWHEWRNTLAGITFIIIPLKKKPFKYFVHLSLQCQPPFPTIQFATYMRRQTAAAAGYWHKARVLVHNKKSRLIWWDIIKTLYKQADHKFEAPNGHYKEGTVMKSFLHIIFIYLGIATARLAATKNHKMNTQSTLDLKVSSFSSQNCKTKTPKFHESFPCKPFTVSGHVKLFSHLPIFIANLAIFSVGKSST